MRAIVERGHGIGNHSATHPQAWFWALPPWRMRDEIERTLAPGTIILLHEGARHGRNVETVAAVLARLAARGYRTVVPG